MLADLRSIPMKIWMIIICIWMVPLLFGLIIQDSSLGAIWFIYLGLVVLTSYFTGLQGGLIIAFISVIIHISFGLISFIYTGYHATELFYLITHSILQFLLAFAIGQLADKLKDKHKEVEDIFNSLDATIWSHDLKKDTIIISTGVELIYGYTGKEFAEDPSLWNKVVHPEDTKIAKKMNEDALSGLPTNTIFRIVRPDGKVRWIQDKATPIFDKNNNLVKINGVVLDITERKLAEEKIKKMAYYDYLTNLPNRKFIHERLTKLVNQSQETISHIGAVMFIDLDGFKQVNDTLGHDVGDKLLIEVSRRIQDSIGNEDILGRLGGDEFVILADDVDEIEGGKIAEKIISNISSFPFIFNKDSVYVTPSIGICMYPFDGDSAEDLLKKADYAMYLSKNLGKNQYQFFNVREDIQLSQLP
ncbi:diguanylate cyclase [Evansella sp. AB-P1]|uniref:diguanylate cyclase domain-containing protein n=1 Tax=Evansella sp. AB-P1 TaxID=3037653 RepID=UPI00241CE5A7|nr:diguanylate cyclase [Evansella sp. AB-P1]MDG5787926.1 diguanylate cyclase [Evansella sp. AB-P1]